MKKILVVDDSPVVLARLSDILQGLNYQVKTALNGEEACRHIASERFNLIITDLNMPVMDGIEFARRARQIPNCKFVPIVMLSSETDQARIADARRMGISTFLAKPIEEGRLTAIVQIVLGA